MDTSADRKFYTVLFQGDPRAAAGMWDDEVAPFGKIIAISSRDEISRASKLDAVLNDEEIHVDTAQDTDFHAWVLERADSQTNEPAYWAAGQIDPTRSSAWTGNHMAAIRFARKEDAQAVSDRLMSKAAIEVRVCDHIWGGAS